MIKLQILSRSCRTWLRSSDRRSWQRGRCDIIWGKDKGTQLGCASLKGNIWIIDNFYYLFCVPSHYLKLVYKPCVSRSFYVLLALMDLQDIISPLNSFLSKFTFTIYSLLSLLVYRSLSSHIHAERGFVSVHVIPQRPAARTAFTWGTYFFTQQKAAWLYQQFGNQVTISFPELPSFSDVV